MLDLFRHAGTVAWPLGLASILGLGIILERLFTLNRLKVLEALAVKALPRAMETNDEAVLNDPKIAAAPVARVLASLQSVRGFGSESIQAAADIAVGMERLRLRRYLGTLATIGSTSPFVGLFGTVLGVMAAFQEMSQHQLTGEKMSAGISEALSATALGLVVAIPAVIAYNALLGKVQAAVLQIQSDVTRIVPLLETQKSQASEKRES